MFLISLQLIIGHHFALFCVTAVSVHAELPWHLRKAAKKAAQGNLRFRRTDY
jgi:hypothetical protein